MDLSIEVLRRVRDDEWAERSSEYTARSGRNFARFIDELFWPGRELLMHLKNRSSAISITDEDISRLTDRFECVYEVSEDSDALQPPDGTTPQRF